MSTDQMNSKHLRCQHMVITNSSFIDTSEYIWTIYKPNLEDMINLENMIAKSYFSWIDNN